MKNIETFLKKIGVKSEIISKLNTDDEIDVTEFVDTFKTSQREVISNDPDFVQKMRDEIRGTELSKVEHKLKKTFGLSAEDIKDKKFDEIISTAFEKTKMNASGTSEELQNRIIALTNENKKLIDEVIPAKENEAREIIKSFKKDSALRTILNSRQLIVKPEVVLPAIQTRFAEKYNVDIDEQNQIIVKTKDGLNPLSKDGSKTLSFDEILDSFLGVDDLNVVKQSNGGEQKQPMFAKKTFDGSTAKPEFNLPGMKKAQENAEQMKNIRTFGK